jgi:hypothetical protein
MYSSKYILTTTATTTACIFGYFYCGLLVARGNPLVTDASTTAATSIATASNTTSTVTNTTTSATAAGIVVTAVI